MASPVDAARVALGTGGTAGTSHLLAALSSLGTPVAGDLVITFIRFTSAPGTVTSTAGAPVLTQLASDTSDASDDQTMIWYRYCDGSESTSFNLTSVNSIKSRAITWKITGAENPATQAPEVSTVAVGTTTANTANPNSRAVTGGPKDVLYLAMMGIGGSAVEPTAAPTSYTTNFISGAVGGGGAATQGAVGAGSRQISASSSDDPGAFTHPAAGTGWTAWTVVIHPPAASAPGPASMRRQRLASRFLTHR